VSATAPAPTSVATRQVGLTLRYPLLAFMYAPFRPTIVLDGSQVATGWGEHTLTVPAVEPAELAITVPYLGFTVGRAHLTIDSSTGATLEYAAPYVTFLRGSLGAPPVRPRGLGLIIAMVVVLVALPLVPILAFTVALGSAVDDASAALESDEDDVAAPPPLLDIADATTFTLEPVGDPTAEQTEAAAAVLTARLGGDATVTADGATITVAFDTPPSEETRELLTAPTHAALRPVLIASAPEPVDDTYDAPAEPAAASPAWAGDLDHYWTKDVATALAGTDCTAPTHAATAPADAGLVACASDGTAKYALGGPVTTAANLATVTTDGVAITFQLDATGTEALRDATGRLTSTPAPGNQLALVGDDLVWTAATVASVISDGTVQLTLTDPDAATLLAAVLTYGTSNTWQLSAAS
jgi:hypothetical protein